ncbi:MAG: sigma-70 family RNA polymerase sigma factor [Gammaproteobacteria bacterium]|nr:sigma-70 family RNA polymerase sigma factor [Gammaproteobacteria bacterium]NND58942.1 sigma-70 family RNA polymerase sigma factor [Gammaproteobacteria bacterium]
MAGCSYSEVDEATIRAARGGARAAQQTIYTTYADAVYTTALRILHQREAAEEVLQDTFVQVLRKLDTYAGDAPLGAWIRRIAVNRALSQLRSAWHRYSQPLDGVAEPQATAPVEFDQHLLDGLERLKPTARAVLWLHDVEGYTHKEIGELMGKTPSFSKSQLSRAHQRMRQWLDASSESVPCMQVLNNC